MDDVEGEDVKNKMQNGVPYPQPDSGTPRIAQAAPSGLGWHQLVDDSTWSVASLKLEPGTSHSNQSHRFCFVLDGDVTVHPRGEIDNGQLVPPGSLAFPRTDNTA